MEIQYLVDNRGKKTSVVVSIRKWEKMQADYLKLQNKLRIIAGIKESLEDIKKAKKTGRKLQTLDSFLNENRSKNF